jgi:hypothetical protein
MILAVAASMSPARLACQATPVAPQEPPTLGEFFRVDRATGAPTPLELAKIKNALVLTGDGREVEFYFEGSASTVTFKAGEPQQFVIRLIVPGDNSGKDLSTAEVRMHVALGPLLVQNLGKGKKSVVGRFVTKTEIPFDIEPFGQSTLGLDPKNPARAAQSFLLTPSVLLTPGKYQIGIRGVHDFEFVHNGLFGREYWAFDIVAR